MYKKPMVPVFDMLKSRAMRKFLGYQVSVDTTYGIYTAKLVSVYLKSITLMFQDYTGSSYKSIPIDTIQEINHTWSYWYREDHMI